MTAEEIMHALRLVAMGRIGTPEQQRLCEALAGLLETPEQRAEREMSAPGADAYAATDALGELKVPAQEGDKLTVKRTRKKAD